MKNLALLTDSYHSRHLLASLAEMKIPVLFANGDHTVSHHPSIQRVSEDELATLLSCKDLRLYINAEDSLNVLKNRPEAASLKQRIAYFKDKYEFRKSLQDSFPDFYMQNLPASRLSTLRVPENRELILKPALGFHSLGIRRFVGQKQFENAVSEAMAEIRSFGDVFEKSVLDGDRFIIEDYIYGEELACDAYFDDTGEPVVNAIYSHAFADANDTRDLVYITSAATMERYLDVMTDFLGLVARKSSARNFPLHLEVRVSNNGIIPIEANPLRFGGFGLADLARHAFGIDSYQSFFLGEKHDWAKILGESDGASYAFVVGQRPEQFDAATHDIRHAAFQETFKELLEYTPIDAGRYRFFATAFARSENPEDFLQYLHMDFSQFKADKASASAPVR